MGCIDMDKCLKNNGQAMTMAEKIFSRLSGAKVKPGDFVTVKPDRLMVNDMMALIADSLEEFNLEQFHDPEKLVVVLDHFVPPPSAKHAAMIRRGVDIFRRHGLKHFLGEAGVSHQVMCEKGFVRPGELVLGTDSHSTLYGALGAAGAGIGATEMTYLLATGELWFQVPETIKVDIRGSKSAAVSAKDVMLALLRKSGGDYARYKAVEYLGEGARDFSISERMTLSNMGAEFGAKFAFFAADEKTSDYLSGRVDSGIEVFSGDQDAEYCETIELDISELEPQVACPHSPDNISDISAIAGLKVDQAYLGSCTNARLEDIAIAASILEGQTVSPDTRLLVVPASQHVMLEATKAGHTETLIEAGAKFVTPGCGACAGLHSGLLAPKEVCISTINRNFAGRMGSPESQLYLASPAVVAASAITGKISDPRTVRPELFS